MKLALIALVFSLSFQAAYAFSDIEHSPLMLEKPVWFTPDALGGFYGETEKGTYFSQRPVALSSGVRLHKFTIAHLYFYVSDKGVIYAHTDLEALSVYFALA